jgi:hypothetical protein
MEKSNGNSPASVGRNSRSRSEDRTWTEIVQKDPVACMAIAAAAGFVLGGGVRRAGSLAILTMLGQLAVREVFGASASLSDFIGEERERTI